jgi:hypothetical protein
MDSTRLGRTALALQTHAGRSRTTKTRRERGRGAAPEGLATIERNARELHAWWERDEKKAVVGDLAWVNESIANTPGKASAIIGTIRSGESVSDALKILERGSPPSTSAAS